MDLKGEILDGYLGGRYQLKGVLFESKRRETLRVWDGKRKEQAVLKYTVQDTADLSAVVRRRLTDVHDDRVEPYSVVEIFDSSVERDNVVVTVRPYRPKTLSNVGLENLSSKDKWRVVGDVLQGLKHLHSKQIVHGDVRPGNILLRGDRHASLVDYGLPPSINEVDDDDRVFLAPEVAKREYDSASDIYSFGRIAQHLVRYSDRQLWANSPIGSSQFEWLVACCLRDSASERPSAEQLWSLLFDRDNMVGEAQSIIRNLSVPDVGKKRVEFNAYALRVEAARQASLSDLLRAPQLALKITDEPSALAYLSLVAKSLTNIAVFEDNKTRKLQGSAHSSQSAALMKEKFPPLIDDEWRMRLEREYSGVLERSLEPATASDAELAERAFELFTHAYAVATEVRSDLLSRCPMLHTSDVVALMSRDQLFTESDVLTFSQSGRMLVLTDHRRFLYPKFQFGEDGAVSQVVFDVNSVLRTSGHEWSTLSWWYTPNSMLGDVEPWELIDDPGRVINAAHVLMR